MVMEAEEKETKREMNMERELEFVGMTKSLTAGKTRVFILGKIKKYLMQSYGQFRKP